MLRARFVIVVGLLALVSSLVPFAGQAAGKKGTDWNRFLGPDLNGKSTETGIRTDWADGKLPVVWQRDIGEGYTAPSVAAGRLFVFDRIGNKARFSCLESDTGKEIWSSTYPTEYVDSFEYSGGPRATPVIDGERVFIFGVDGLLRAHGVSDGEILWEIDTTDEFGVVQNFFGAGSTPIVEGDLLITMVGGSPPDSPTVFSGKTPGNDSGIVAFDKATGEVRYSITDELASYSSPVTATINGRRWAFAFARGGLLGFEPASGKPDFHHPWRSSKLYSVNAATPVVVDDTVLITESYGPGSLLLRVDPGGYEVLRKDPRRRGQSMASHWATPIYHEGFLYGSSGEKEGSADLRAIDHRTGDLKWAEKGLGRLTLMYVDDHFVVLTERGRMLLVRATAESFQLVTEATFDEPLGYPSWNAPILSHGLMYVRGSKRLVAFELIPQK